MNDLHRNFPKRGSIDSNLHCELSMRWLLSQKSRATQHFAPPWTGECTWEGGRTRTEIRRNFFYKIVHLVSVALSINASLFRPFRPPPPPCSIDVDAATPFQGILMIFWQVGCSFVIIKPMICLYVFHVTLKTYKRIISLIIQRRAQT